MSFLQLYNEKIYDLMNDGMFKGKFFAISGNHKEGLKLKWNTHDVYTVENLTHVTVEKFQELLLCYNHGIKNKASGSHKLNLSSSRSHTVFCLTLE